MNRLKMWLIHKLGGEVTREIYRPIIHQHPMYMTEFCTRYELDPQVFGMSQNANYIQSLIRTKMLPELAREIYAAGMVDVSLEHPDPSSLDFPGYTAVVCKIPVLHKEATNPYGTRWSE